jgi:hypothetical protein
VSVNDCKEASCRLLGFGRDWPEKEKAPEVIRRLGVFV